MKGSTEFNSTSDKLISRLSKAMCTMIIEISYESSSGIEWCDDMQYIWPPAYNLLGRDLCMSERDFGVAAVPNGPNDRGHSHTMSSFYPHTLLHCYSSPGAGDHTPFWLPCVDKPGSTLTFAISIAVPPESNLTVVASGTPISPTVRDDKYLSLSLSLSSSYFDFF